MNDAQHNCNNNFRCLSYEFARKEEEALHQLTFTNDATNVANKITERKNTYVIG